MRNFLTVLATATLLTSPVAVAAGPKDCPPGLAKKGSCTPPGLAEKGVERDGVRYNRGERIGDYIIIRDVDRYGLDRTQTYARSGDYIYRIDRQTREVLNLIGAVSALLN